MKRITLILVSLASFIVVNAQNLVQNGEFTNLGYCVGCTDPSTASTPLPTTFSTVSNPEITKAIGWNFGYALNLASTIGTADLYSVAAIGSNVTINPCTSTFPAGAPCHYFAPPVPSNPTSSMQNYAAIGLIASDQVSEMAGESLLGNLIAPLVPGKRYTFSCQVHTASSGNINFIMQLKNNASNTFTYGTIVEQNIPTNQNRQDWTAICMEIEVPSGYSGLPLNQIELGGNVDNGFNVGLIFIDRVSLRENPVIHLPDAMKICDGNFQPLCGPSAPMGETYSYQWLSSSNNVVSTAQCFTPTQYGSYTLVVSNSCGFQTSHTTTIQQGAGPEVIIPDITYCGALPLTVGLPGPYADALSYAWTFDNGAGPVPVQGAMGGAHQVPYQGDGEYCVTITWSDAVVPELSGCTSTACFTAEYCCVPDVSFDHATSYVNPNEFTISVQPAVFVNTNDYDTEDYVLYQYCGSSALSCSSLEWTEIGLVSRNSNFTTPVVFSNSNNLYPGYTMDPACQYKIEHRVYSECKNKVYVDCHLLLVGKINLRVSPNPLSAGQSVTIEMTSLSEESILTISDAQSGAVVHKGTIRYGHPEVIDHAILQASGSGRRVQLFNIQVTNSYDSVNKKLIVR